MATWQEQGIPAAVVTKFLSSRRIEIEKTGLYSFLVLFSMGITKGKWSTLVTELHQVQGSLRRERAAERARCRPSPPRIPRPTRRSGLKDLCDAIHQVYREDDLPKAQREMYTVAARDGDAAGRCLRAAGATGGSRASRSTT